MASNPFEDLFDEHATDDVPDLWRWQKEVLSHYAKTDGDAAVELPTGAGKTLIGLLAGELHRSERRERVAFLAGNKQLAQQVERQARDQEFEVVRFEGRKHLWDPASIRKYNFGEAIGVMNYWNYFNALPGIEPAGMLILDDVHLLEGRLREMFTVSLSPSHPLFEDVLKRIAECYPYYARAEDLLNGISPQQPPEMLAFPDSADLAPEIRDLLDSELEQGSEIWWAWQKIREQLELCCWLVSSRAVTFAPYIPPTQTLDHFSRPSRRLYLSATLGTVDDLRRRLGAPDLTKLESSVEPKQGRRMVVIRDATEAAEEVDLVAELDGILKKQKKALWLCARKDTLVRLEAALIFSGLKGGVRILEGDNGEDEPFAREAHGQLLAAGRYDGMDFPDDACRLEVVPEVPIATSDLEEFVSSYLRDAPFAEARFGQRVAQALGRCNRSEDDRAVYLLTDPEFLGRFNQPRILDALPGHARDDVFTGLIRADNGFQAGLDEAQRFLGGDEVEEQQAPPPMETDGELPTTAEDEVEGFLALWAGDYEAASEHFDDVARDAAAAREYRGFWLAMRALALKRAADLGDAAASRKARLALKAAASTGGRNTFFSRLRLSEVRAAGKGAAWSVDGDDDLFASWDRLMDKFGSVGTRFDQWCKRILEDLHSSDHDTVARTIAAVGCEILGLNSSSPKATKGEADAHWELGEPRRTLVFEVKLAPKAKRMANKDVEQAEGAAKAVERERDNPVRGILITPYPVADDTTEARLERVRLLALDVFVEQVEMLISAFRIYRRHWGESSEERGQARDQAVQHLPPTDWLWKASLAAEAWIEREDLDEAWENQD